MTKKNLCLLAFAASCAIHSPPSAAQSETPTQPAKERLLIHVKEMSQGQTTTKFKDLDGQPTTTKSGLRIEHAMRGQVIVQKFVYFEDDKDYAWMELEFPLVPNTRFDVNTGLFSSAATEDEKRETAYLAMRLQGHGGFTVLTHSNGITIKDGKIGGRVGKTLAGPYDSYFFGPKGEIIADRDGQYIRTIEGPLKYTEKSLTTGDFKRHELPVSDLLGDALLKLLMPWIIGGVALAGGAIVYFKYIRRKSKSQNAA